MSDLIFKKDGEEYFCIPSPFSNNYYHLPKCPETKLEIKMTEQKFTLELTLDELKLIDKYVEYCEETKEFFDKLKDAYPKQKSPAEEAFKDNYGVYPNELKTTDDFNCWKSFKRGYVAAQEDYKVGEYQEPVKNKMPLYYRFREFGCLIPDSEGFCKIVKDFLMDEGVIEDESGEYITFTLQKYLLDTPND